MLEEERKFLEIVNLKKGFGSGETRQEVLRGMNLSVAKGEICVLLGPSGSGKSTLLNIIGGIDSADSGCIYINSDKLEDMGEKNMKTAVISLKWQEFMTDARKLLFLCRYKITVPCLVWRMARSAAIFQIRKLKI